MVIKNGSSQTVLQITKANVPLNELFALLYGYPREDSGPQDPNAFDAYSVFFMGNDTIIGSNDGDDILGGRSRGNDKIMGKGGDDFLKGDAGNDEFNGGSGFDRLSYTESFFDPTATRGIKLDAKKGTVKDSWGGTDTFENIEAFEGSKHRDVMKGSGADEEFGGLRGNDVINGRGGFDLAYYWSDGNRGGLDGIVANLATGKIKDGWGNIDTVKNIEGVAGTSQADTFIGNGKDNVFVGLQGIDSFAGGGGFDKVEFWGNGIGAVNVDLAIVGSEIQNDGYGNTETATSIEGARGNEGDDTLRGNGADNQFDGAEGEDTLNGRGGNDDLRGGDGADTFEFDLAGAAHADFVNDYEDGVDMIALSIAAFGLSGSVGDPLAAGEFVVGANATAPGQRIVYNSGNGRLFWDSDGNGATAKQLIAEFNGAPDIGANDIVLIA